MPAPRDERRALAATSVQRVRAVINWTGVSMDRWILNAGPH
jgi:hypothetical protein